MSQNSLLPHELILGPLDNKVRTVRFVLLPVPELGLLPQVVLEARVVVVVVGALELEQPQESFAEARVLPRVYYGVNAAVAHCYGVHYPVDRGAWLAVRVYHLRHCHYHVRQPAHREASQDH